MREIALHNRQNEGYAPLTTFLQANRESSSREIIGFCSRTYKSLLFIVVRVQNILVTAPHTKIF